MPNDPATPQTDLPGDAPTGSDSSESELGTPQGDPEDASGAAAGAGSGKMDPAGSADDHGRSDTSDTVDPESPGRADASRPPRGAPPA